jgi:hypothetical protein
MIGAHDRRAQELHDRKGVEQPSAVGRCFADRTADERHDDLGQHRNDDAESDGVDEHGDEDEQKSKSARTDFGHNSPRRLSIGRQRNALRAKRLAEIRTGPAIFDLPIRLPRRRAARKQSLPGRAA